MADGVQITKDTEVNAKELAAVLGVTVRRVQEIAADEHIFDRCSRGRYKLCECVQKYMLWKSKSRPSSEAIADAERARAVAEAELKQAKAGIAQLELDELKGKMHRAEDVQALTNDMIYGICSDLNAFPGRVSMDVAPEMTPAEASAILRKEVNAMMDSWKDYHYDPEKYEERVMERMKWENSEDDESE